MDYTILNALFAELEMYFESAWTHLFNDDALVKI